MFAKNFIEVFRTMQNAAHNLAKEKGWWDKPREDGTVIALIHTELSELMNAICRKEGNSKVITFSKEEEELADVCIRIMDFAERKGYRLGAAILAKHEYNKTRSYRHGED